MSDEKYMSTVKVGAKGQIVIPKEVRDMFNIKPGDSLMLLADTQRGIAINRTDYFNSIAEQIFKKNIKIMGNDDNPEHLEIFAQNIKKAETQEVILNDCDKD